MNALRIQKNVSLASAEQSKKRWENRQSVPRPYNAHGGRVGTINLSLFDFADKIGDPHEAVPREHWRDYKGHDLLDGAGKVSALWHFTTPRGIVEVGDYWWNKEDELSVRAADIRSLRWFYRWCKLHGIPTKGKDATT